jgi:type II secretory pathway pseudopilin PulG
MATGNVRFVGFGRRAGGFTYFGVLFLIMLLGLGLGGACEIWSVTNQRAQERQLLWVGTQYARALKTYYEQSPGARQYPLKLEDLLEDRRFPVPKRHLRKLYADPVGRGSGWITILNADGRIGGVRSQSEQTPMKQAGFPLRWEDFNGRAKYAEWRFVADVNLLEVKKPVLAVGNPLTPANERQP